MRWLGEREGAVREILRCSSSVSCSFTVQKSSQSENTCRTNEDSTFGSVQVAVDTDVLRLTGKAEGKGTVPE